jgi:DHA1 family bicyclomycin/chloramphenicol resistance-like MFS transporter
VSSCDHSETPRQADLVVVVALLSMLGPFTIDTYLPSFPSIQADLGVGPASMAQTLSFYLLAFAATTLLWGPVSDAFGRRRAVAVSLLAYIVTSLGCALAPDFPTLLTFRVLQGLAASAGVVVGRAMIRDVHAGPKAQRAMSSVMLLFAIAPAIAPIIGGLLQDAFGWRSVFFFLAAYGVAALALVRFAMPETLPRHARQSIHPMRVLGAYARTLRRPRFLALVLAVALAFGGIFLYVSGSPAVVFDHLGYGADDFAVLFVPFVGGLMLGSFVSGRLAHRWPSQTIVRSAFGVMLLASLLNIAQAYGLPPAPWNVIGPLALYACGAALAMPGITIMSLDCFPQQRGVASGMQGFVQMVVMAVVGGALMPLVHAHILYFALGQFALLCLALLSWTVAARLRPPPAAS